MSSLCLFQILLYRNHSRKNSDNNSVISTMFRIWKCFASKSWLSHNWVHWVCPWHGLSWFCASQDDTSFFCRIAYPLQRTKGCVRPVQCLNSSYSLLSGDVPCFLSEPPTPRTEDSENKKPTTNLCCGHTLLMDIPPGLCQPLLQAAASAICGIALVLLLPVGEGATLQGMHAFVEKFFHHAPFLINCCFLLYSECHFSMPRMPKF